MKPFESFLGQKMQEYITYRQSLGYTIQNLKSCLGHLDRYLKQTEADWDSFQPLFFLNFRESIKGESSMITVIMGEVRRFFQFLIRGGMIEENPLQDIPRPHQEAFIPFVFSPKADRKFTEGN